MAEKTGQTIPPKETSHIYGLDILKILSMVYVVILHALGQGGMMGKGSMVMQFAVMALFYVTTPAVNIFALVTGYVSYSDKKKPLNRKRLFEMWFQVVFYALLITAVCFFVLPGKVTAGDFASSVMPLLNDIYWYFTAYFIVSVLSPFINAAVRALPEPTLKIVFAVIIFFFSIFASFCYSLNIITSHTFTWIFMLYILGAIMKKCRIGEKLPAGILLFGIIGCNLFNWIITWAGEKILSGSDWYLTILGDYISPTMVIQTICYLLLFKKIRTTNGAQKVIKFIAPLVFAAYLADTHPVVYRDIWDGLFTPLTEWNVFLMILFLIGFGIVFVAAACIVDKIRSLLFKLIRIDKLAIRIAGLTVRITDAIARVSLTGKDISQDK